MSYGMPTLYAILNNGSPADFFKGSNGIKKGFLLSPIMFILVIEGLSCMISKSNVEGKIKGVKILHLFLLPICCL